MEAFLAHSSRDGCPPQTYEAHIRGVYAKASAYVAGVEQYTAKAKDILTEIVQKSALMHDLGKMDDENQNVLHSSDRGKRHLPINHVDAGSAALKSQDSQDSLYAALMVYSHHRGLPDLETESLREEAIFRDEHAEVRKRTDETLDELLRRHEMIFRSQAVKETQPYDGDQNVLFRMALSCLADADHSDTALAYGQAPTGKKMPLLRAEERLTALDKYVSQLGGGDERSLLRSEMYQACRNAKINSGFSMCDSPVGSGKTTAVMAHLLQQASQRNSRRIFVVLPYTSIIQQSVDVYRKALVLPEENPEEVVAELHSRADFQDFGTRYLTSLWRAPIIVTTAVAFFETLSSCQPSALRRLHELPGSVIFVDEAHNALPIKLLPLAWRWLNVLADEWSCYWVLASGSLVRYWELDRLKEIGMAQPKVTELVRYDLRNQLMAYEQNRIAFLNKESPVSRRDLIEWVANSPGPRLLILNTVQSAAVIASDMAQKYGRGCVEHLSTALTPEDRSKTIKRIKQRLKDTSDRDWTLVATSCVEAGVDFSFRTGFREMSSLLSLLQAAGRVNRHGQLKDAEMWSFSLQDDSMLSQNKSLECSADVLKDYFARKIPITPELSTRSMNDGIIRDDSCIKTIKQLMEQENVMQFRTVDREFEVIDADTIPAVVNLSLAEEIAHGRSDWKTLQRQSVSIRRDKIKRWNLKEIAPGVYRWTLGYNDFLGYMSGVINTGKTIFC